MSASENDDAVTEDATVEQVHAAEPEHPDPVPGTEPDPAEAGSTAELREQIEETRSELGDTVEALTHKLDVKARAKEGFEERKQQAKDGVHQAGQAVEEHRTPVTTIAAVAGVLVLVVLWRRSR